VFLLLGFEAFYQLLADLFTQSHNLTPLSDVLK
jgi:hypothetical protein